MVNLLYGLTVEIGGFTVLHESTTISLAFEHVHVQHADIAKCLSIVYGKQSAK